ncbi:TPA: hypothetical protein M4X45_002649, partial [Enterococcus faecium]|nr:hypothetical protein [Enterococcus faecium]
PKEGTDLEFSIKVTNTKENLFSIPDIQYTPNKLKIGDTFGLAKVNEQYFAYSLK